MNTSQKMGLAATGVFAISHALPAYVDGSGFACFRLTLSMLFGRNTEFLSGSWFYYSAFALSNIFFLTLVAALFAKKWRGARTTISVVLLLHVLSWPIVNAFGSPPTLHDIKIGYYLWLVAYGLLVTAQLWKKPIETGKSASIS